MSKVRVLIADNSKDFSTLLSKRLSMSNTIEIVGVAQDGMQTINMLNQTTPDVLLLDIVMPNIDGLEVLKRIQEVGHKPMIFVVSALGDEQLSKQALALGANYYFVKPLNIEMLINKILETSSAV